MAVLSDQLFGVKELVMCIAPKGPGRWENVWRSFSHAGNTLQFSGTLVHLPVSPQNRPSLKGFTYLFYPSSQLQLGPRGVLCLAKALRAKLGSSILHPHYGLPRIGDAPHFKEPRKRHGWLLPVLSTSTCRNEMFYFPLLVSKEIDFTTRNMDFFPGTEVADNSLDLSTPHLTTALGMPRGHCLSRLVRKWFWRCSGTPQMVAILVVSL